MGSFETPTQQYENSDYLADNIRDYEKSILQSKIYSNLNNKKVRFILPNQIREPKKMNDDQILQRNVSIYNDGLNEFFIVDDQKENDTFILQHNLKCFLNGLEKLENPCLFLNCNNQEDNSNQVENDITRLIIRQNIAQLESKHIIENCESEFISKTNENCEHSKNVTLDTKPGSFDKANDQNKIVDSVNGDSCHISKLAETDMSSGINLKNNLIDYETYIKHIMNENLFHDVTDLTTVVTTKYSDDTNLQQNILDYNEQISDWFHTEENVNTSRTYKSSDITTFSDSERRKFALKTVEKVVAEAKIICDRVLNKINIETADISKDVQQIDQECIKTGISLPDNTVNHDVIYSENSTDGTEYKTHNVEECNKNEVNQNCISSMKHNIKNNVPSADLISKRNMSCDEKDNTTFEIDEKLNTTNEQPVSIQNETLPFGKEYIHKVQNDDSEYLEKLNNNEGGAEDDDIFGVLGMTNQNEYSEDLCSPKSSPKLMRLMQSLAKAGYYDDESETSDEDEKRATDKNVSDVNLPSLKHDISKDNNNQLSTNAMYTINMNNRLLPAEISSNLTKDLEVKNNFTSHLQQNIHDYDIDITAWLHRNTNEKGNLTGKPTWETKLPNTEQKYIVPRTAGEVVAEAKLICDRILLEHNSSLNSQTENYIDNSVKTKFDNCITKTEAIKHENEDDDIFRVLEMTDYENEYDEDLCSPKSSPKLMRLIQSLALNNHFEDDADYSDDSDDDCNKKDGQVETFADVMPFSGNNHKTEECSKNKCTDTLDKLNLENKTVKSMIVTDTLNNKTDCNDKNYLPPFQSSPHRPPRKKKSMSVSCLQSEMLDEEIILLKNENFKTLNNFFNNSDIIVPPPRKNRKNQNKCSMSYSMSDISVIDFDSDFFRDIKNTEDNKNSENFAEIDLHYNSQESHSKHEIHFTAPEVSSSIVEYNVFNPRLQNERASIVLIDELDGEDKAKPTFEARKTPHIKKKSFTFTSSDTYAKEAMEKVSLKRSKSSVSKMIKKTFSFKKVHKNHHTPCMPNILKRYMKVRKNKKNKSKCMESIPEEVPFSGLKKTESFASIFMGSSCENIELDNLEAYVTSSFLSFPQDSSPNIQRSASNVEFLTEFNCSSRPVQRNRLKRSSSFIQITANPKSFVKRLATEDSTVSLNPEAIKRAHELLNKSIALGGTDSKIKIWSTDKREIKSDLISENKSCENISNKSQILKVSSLDNSENKSKNTGINAGQPIMSTKFIQSSFDSLSRLSSAKSITNSTQSLASSVNKSIYDEKQFAAPLSLLKIKNDNAEMSANPKEKESLNTVHERSQKSQIVIHSFKVIRDDTLSLSMPTVPTDNGPDNNVVYSFPFTSEIPANKNTEIVENKGIIGLSYKQNLSNEISADRKELNGYSSINSELNEMNNKFLPPEQIDSILPNNCPLNEMNNKFLPPDRIDSILSNNGPPNLIKIPKENETICPLQVLKNINNKIQCIHERMQKNSEELSLSTHKMEFLTSPQVYSNDNDHCDITDLEYNTDELSNNETFIDSSRDYLEDHNHLKISPLENFTGGMESVVGDIQKENNINDKVNDPSMPIPTTYAEEVNVQITQNVSNDTKKENNIMTSVLCSSSENSCREDEKSSQFPIDLNQCSNTKNDEHIIDMPNSISKCNVNEDHSPVDIPDVISNSKNFENVDSNVVCCYKGEKIKDCMNNNNSISLSTFKMDEDHDEQLICENGTPFNNINSQEAEIVKRLDYLINIIDPLSSPIDYESVIISKVDIQRSHSLPAFEIPNQFSNRKTITLGSPITDRKFIVTWPVNRSKKVKLFKTTKEYNITYENGVTSHCDSVSLNETKIGHFASEKNDFLPLPPAKSLPEIILRTWSERQDSTDVKWDQRNSCESDISNKVQSESKTQIHETKSTSVKKEEDRVQKDRCVEVYPETIRQRQRNMAPSPNRVDIKNWEVADEIDVVKDKKLLPSVKALRNQFENGGREESHSPTGNSITGRSSTSSSTSSLSLPSLEVSSNNTSLTSGQSIIDYTESTELNGPIDPIYRQFRNFDQDIMGKPPSTIGWNPMPLLKKLYYLPKAPTISNKESSFIDIEGYLDKLPCGRKKSTFWNAWKRRYFCAKKGVLYCYHNNVLDKLSMKLPLLGGKVEIMDPNVVSVEDGKNDANSSGMLGIDDGKGHYVVVRCPSREEAERWKTALESHVIDDFASQYVQPWPRPTTPALLRDTIVIDIGSCSVRAGVLASQATLPQIFFPTVVATNRETQRQIWGKEALLPEVRTLSNISFPIKPSHKISKFSVDLNAVSSLLQKIFMDLNVDSKNYNIQLSVPRVLNPTTQTELMKILFDKFGVKGVNLTHQSILALYAYNATSGIVVDIGERIDVVPIIDGYIVDGGVSRVPYGGYRILEHLKHYLFQKNISLLNEAESYIIRAVLEMVCYSAQHYNTEKARCTKAPDNFEKHAALSDFFPNTTQFEAFHDISLNFGRFQATEGLFTPEAWGLDHPGLHKLVHKAIQECSMDIRKEMSKSVFLAGGVSQLPGLSDRLRTELDNLTPPAVRPKVHSSPYRYHASYLGACVLAESPAFLQSKISREDWQKHGNSSLIKWAL